MRFGSVCSGIEAASVAWHPLGWRAAWLAEIEPFPSAVLKHHYPEVPNLGDMTTLPARICSGEVEAPDLFCGGTPCQAFSVAGLRRSLDDARGNLSLIFCEIADAIDAVRLAGGKPASIVFWENVPGVLSTADNAFGCFLAGLAGEDEPLVPAGDKWTDAGCVFGPKRAVAWRVLNAEHFALAQRRKRVFVIASARDGFDPAAVLFEWEGVRRDTPPSREAGKGTAHDTAPCLTSSGRGVGRTGDTRGQDPVVAVAFGGNNQAGPIDVATARNACASASASGRMDFESETFLVQPAHTLRSEGFDASEDGTGRGTPLVPCVASTLKANNGGGGFGSDPSETFVPVEQPYTLAIRGRGDSHNLEYRQDGTANALLTPNGGRGGIGVGAIAFHPTQDPISSTDVCHAIGTGNGQGCATAAVAVQAIPIDTMMRRDAGGEGACVLPPVSMQVRRLTPVECERLQGFPDGYTAIPWRGKPASECPDGPRYKALGNSWAVPVVRWIGRRINERIGNA